MCICRGGKFIAMRGSRWGSVVRTLPSSPEDTGVMAGLTPWVRIRHSRELCSRSQRRLGSCIAMAGVERGRPAAAPPMPSRPGYFPYATGVAFKCKQN